MNGVSRFLSKRERKPKGSSAENAAKCGTACPELYKVFTSEETKKKSDKEEEKKIKAVTLRLTQLGITNLRDAQIEYALRAKTTNGDIDKAADLLGVFEDSVEGIVRDYRPTIKLLGAENRQAVTCYLDALLFAMFAKLDTFEALLFDTFTDTPRKNLASMLRLWVNMLRSGKLITTDIVKHIQDTLAECGWADAAQLRQQDTSEAFTFITDKLQLPLLTLKMDIYHFGKEDVKDDHRVVHERLLEVAIPEKDDGTVTLEECLENYFNNRIEVKRHLQRRNTLQSLRSYQAAKSEALHIETTEVEVEPSPSPSRPASPAVPLTESPISRTSTSPPAFLSARLRTDSIFSEKRVPVEEDRARSKDDGSISQTRPRASTIRREVLMPAWQFFSLIPWYTDDTANPTTDAQVAAHFSTKRPVLGICLKRYKMQQDGRSKRLNTHVDIPLEIALPEFVSDEHKYEDFGDFKLSLESVVCHRGVSTHAGHYVALVRGVAPRSPSTDRPASADGKPVETPWMRFDDLAAERVTVVDIGKALKEESPYLLFYQVQPIDDDLPPSYAEAQQDSPPQPPADREHVVDGSETDLSSSTVLTGGTANLPSSSSTDLLQAQSGAPSTDDLQASEETVRPNPVSRSDSKLVDNRHVGAATDSTDFATQTRATAASLSNYELGATDASSRASLDVSHRRASVSFDTASSSIGGTPAPSVNYTASTSGSVKTPSTAPVTPGDEGSKSWLPSISSSRRNSRSEKGRSSDTARGKEKRPSSQSGENRLSLTMSRLSGKLSKDKLLSNFMPSTGASNSAQNATATANGSPSEDEPMVTVTEYLSNTSSRAAAPDDDPALPYRPSFDMVIPPVPPMPDSFNKAGSNPGTTNAASISRSRSLRHKHILGHSRGRSRDEDKQQQQSQADRSKSRGRANNRDSSAHLLGPTSKRDGSYSTAERDAAVARSSVEFDGRPVIYSEAGDGLAAGSTAATSASAGGSLRKKKGGGGESVAAGGRAGQRPDRECAVM